MEKCIAHQKKMRKKCVQTSLKYHLGLKRYKLSPDLIEVHS